MPACPFCGKPASEMQVYFARSSRREYVDAHTYRAITTQTPHSFVAHNRCYRTRRRLIWLTGIMAVLGWLAMAILAVAWAPHQAQVSLWDPIFLAPMALTLMSLLACLALWFHLRWVGTHGA